MIIEVLEAEHKAQIMERKKLLPPAYFITYLLLAVGLHFVIPIVKFIRTPYNYTGILLLGIGIWLNIWADKLFKKKGTTVNSFEKSSFFIEEGPFRFSRNPMYLGMVIILTGVAVLLGSITPFLVPAGFFITMNVVFIPDEERAMEETFGEQFLDYKKRIRRWL